MPRLTETHAKIVDLALSLLQARGFHGFSYRHLADTLGVKTAAIHYHFRRKEDLGVALATKVRGWFEHWTEEVEEQHDSALARLDAFFELHEGFLKKRQLSPFGALQSEYARLPERMQVEVQALAAEVHGWLGHTLEEGQASEEFTFRGDAAAQAVLVGATVQGALAIARAFGADRYRAAIAQLRRQMLRE